MSRRGHFAGHPHGGYPRGGYRPGGYGLGLTTGLLTGALVGGALASSRGNNYYYYDPCYLRIVNLTGEKIIVIAQDRIKVVDLTNGGASNYFRLDGQGKIKILISYSETESYNEYDIVVKDHQWYTLVLTKSNKMLIEDQETLVSRLINPWLHNIDVEIGPILTVVESDSFIQIANRIVSYSDDLVKANHRDLVLTDNGLLVLNKEKSYNTDRYLIEPEVVSEIESGQWSNLTWYQAFLYLYLNHQKLNSKFKNDLTNFVLDSEAPKLIKARVNQL